MNLVKAFILGAAATLVFTGCKQRRPTSASLVQSDRDQNAPNLDALCAELKIHEISAKGIRAGDATVAVVQFDPGPATRAPTRDAAISTVMLNFGRFRCYAKRARQLGAKLIVAPEMGLVGYPRKDNEIDDYAAPAELLPYGEIVPRPGTPLAAIPPKGSELILALAQLAKEQQITIVAGLAEREGDGTAARLYNVSVVLGSDGSVQANHRKVNLVDEGGSRESSYVARGDKNTVSRFEAAPNVPFGLMICADVYGDENRKIDLPLNYKNSGQTFRGIIVPSYWDSLPDDKRATERGRRYFGSVCQYMNTPVLVSNFGSGTQDAGILVPDGRNCDYQSGLNCCTESVWWNQPTPAGKDGVLLFGGVP